MKLNLLRNDFLPRLRQKYPYSEILIFDDWNSSPQWPRTKAEDKVFYKCMEHMNYDDENASGTSLFIAATLLQRELVELIVPVQAALVLSVLYMRDLKLNSLVSNWNSQDD